MSLFGEHVPTHRAQAHCGTPRHVFVRGENTPGAIPRRSLTEPAEALSTTPSQPRRAAAPALKPSHKPLVFLLVVAMIGAGLVGVAVWQSLHKPDCPTDLYGNCVGLDQPVEGVNQDKTFPQGEIEIRAVGLHLGLLYMESLAGVINPLDSTNYWLDETMRIIIYSQCNIAHTISSFTHTMCNIFFVKLILPQRSAPDFLTYLISYKIKKAGTHFQQFLLLS
jgi:hypothetical protein